MRTYLAPRAGTPAYVLSVTSRDLRLRKERWAEEALSGRVRTEPTPREPHARIPSQAGLLVKVDNEGQIVATEPCDGVQGLLSFRGELLAACHGEIERRDWNLARIGLLASLPSFNDLHSMRQSEAGTLLVAATGTDSVLELSPGGELVWNWWAADHGFDHDSFGVRRALDKHADHRQLIYDTWTHSTHLNSAVPWKADQILVSLFHQGAIVRVDKASGRADPVVSQLRRPHALRTAGRAVTFAESPVGRAVVGQVTADRFRRDRDVCVATGWLQDARLAGAIWIMVDGENSRVIFQRAEGTVVAIDSFDEDWLLYETEVVPARHCG
jgi:hypothetical protein